VKTSLGAGSILAGLTLLLTGCDSTEPKPAEHSTKVETPAPTSKLAWRDSSSNWQSNGTRCLPTPIRPEIDLAMARRRSWELCTRLRAETERRAGTTCPAKTGRHRALPLFRKRGFHGFGGLKLWEFWKALKACPVHKTTRQRLSPVSLFHHEAPRVKEILVGGNDRSYRNSMTACDLLMAATWPALSALASFCPVTSVENWSTRYAFPLRSRIG